MTALTLFTIAFAGLASVIVAAIVTQKSKNKRRSRAMAIISGHGTHVPSTSKKEGEQKEELSAGTSPTEIAAKLKKAAREQKAMHDTQSLSSLIMQAGLSITPLQFWIYSIAFGTVTTGILWSTSLSRIIVVLLAFTAFFGFPRFFLKFKARRRQKAFLNDFADAIEAMIRLLKAGMPVGEAIAMVGREFTGPVGEEMSRIYDAQKLGVPMQDAVRKMAPRMPLPEVQMFATSIAIQVQTGSSLSEVLGNLSGVIRARYRLKRKIEALSAEAKISAMIIGALPILVSLALWGVNPDYIALLFTHPTGKMLAAGAITWMCIGIIVMRQMINFRV
jgi:tight adherence protein B